MENNITNYNLYLKSFSKTRTIEKDEMNTLNFKKALQLGDIKTYMIYEHDHLLLKGKLTSSGRLWLPMTWYHKCIAWLLSWI